MIDVIVATRIETILTYKVPSTLNEEVKVGSIVVAPLRNRDVLGVVAHLHTTPTLNTLNNDINVNIRELSKVLPFKPLSTAAIELMKWVAKYNVAVIGMVGKMFLQSSKILELAAKYELSQERPRVERASKVPELWGQQQEAYDFLSKDQQRHGVVVIEGVTGSGKTAVYVNVIADMLKQGKQVLLLLPEIVLTTQILQRLKEYFPQEICCWHSGITNKERYINWKKVNQGVARLIVGARSALFLPYQDLGLIVVDEEHDTSYKQEDGVIYNARDVAVLYGKLVSAQVILVSATPSVETMYNVLNHKYQCVKLTQRYGHAMMPKVEVISLLQHKLPKATWVAQPLRDKICETLAQGLQSMIFINRRGYAPTSMCLNCGYLVHCTNCSTNMIYHKKTNQLRCHYCGFSTTNLKECPKCSEVLENFGTGAERIAEEVLEFLPEARVRIMTSDTISNLKHAKRMIEEIETGAVDIIVGTQMIAKGLHFSRLHLVGILDANFTSSTGDFRESERMYQLIHQVSGRAGREEKQGLVMIQTMDEGNAVLQHILDNNQEEFYREEIEMRVGFKMPPYTRMAIIHASCAAEPLLVGVMHRLARAFPTDLGVNIFGPAPSPIAMLRNKYRYRFIIIANKNLNLQHLLKFWLDKLDIPHNIEIKVDIDPYSFA